MSTFCLIISVMCFISAFGVHIQCSNRVDGWCPYMAIPWMSAIPWISGFVLAVIPESFLFDIRWWWLFLINIPVVYIIGPLFTSIVMRRITSGKGAGFDVIISMMIALVALIIGILLK
ncbi:MAG: hypothetical protein J6Q36_06445 [Alistipes sp.]|nr:hypothetical protein [Alistipes sp.]